jgi:cytochrome c556
LEANLHFRVYAAALMVTWAGAMAVAQKVTTPEELDKMMKGVQKANMAVGKAVASGAFADAAKHLAIVKQAVDDSREFWVQNKKDDAIKFNKDVIAKIESAEKLLSAPTPDPAAATAAVKQIGPACRSCHEVYRVRDADNNWVLKPGSIGG